MDAHLISHGLIIDQPWIDYILDGRKTWELRSTSCSKRGPIALIRKGSKQVVAIANLIDATGPLTKTELQTTIHKHHVPTEVFNEEKFKWYHAWVFDSIIPLKTPIEYKHKNGAVIWVELNNEAREQLSLINSSSSILHMLPNTDVKNSCVIDDGDNTLVVPQARDGTVFCPESCSRNGVYTVGNKGEEQRFTSFVDALDYLRKMPTAKWRRPNTNGNWGIVSAIDWID